MTPVQKRLRNPFRIGILIVLISAGGCAGMAARTSPPITVAQVVAMSKQGVPPGVIIAKIRESGTVFRLSGSEYAKLSEQGVSNQVLDYMQQTYIKDMRQTQEWEDELWPSDYDNGFWFGGFGWRGFH